MTEPRHSRLRAQVGALPTGTKMLLVLGLALLPLLIISILASIDEARASRANSVIEMNRTLALSAQRLSSVINRAALVVRIASDAAGRLDTAPLVCERASTQLRDSGSPPSRFAIFANGRIVCPAPGFIAAPLPQVQAGAASAARIDARRGLLRLWLFDSTGQPQGQIDFTRAALEAAAAPQRTSRPVRIDLAAEGGTMQLYSSDPSGNERAGITLTEPLTASGLELRLQAPRARLTGIEVLMVALPLMMWLLAALVGWLVVKQLLLRPLLAMQRAIAGYQPGDSNFELPEGPSPAKEITDLGNAFAQVTRTVARHEADLEAAVERQTRLVREVHHRVKNNLQVVASLLNIHSRSSPTEEVAAAYASIQRRVDALAVVHRNHYAELEENRGVALKALVSELGASLRASAPTDASRMQVRLALEPFYATQDVAVSIAFLVTEVVEFGMLCGAKYVSITLEPDESGRARLSLESDSLAGEATCSMELQDRFNRIVAGLVRQLRSTLDRDLEGGRYSLTIAVVGHEQG